MNKHRWAFKLRTEQEATGQWFASWNEIRLAGYTMPAGCAPYADSEERAIMEALRLIADDISFTTSAL
jgi:hypothetical protein